MKYLYAKEGIFDTTVYNKIRPLYIDFTNAVIGEINSDTDHNYIESDVGDRDIPEIFEITPDKVKMIDESHELCLDACIIRFEIAEDSIQKPLSMSDIDAINNYFEEIITKAREIVFGLDGFDYNNKGNGTVNNRYFDRISIYDDLENGVEICCDITQPFVDERRLGNKTCSTTSFFNRAIAVEVEISCIINENFNINFL